MLTCVVGQNVTVINNYNGPEGKLDPEDYVLKNVVEHTFIINEYEPVNTSPRSALDAMISYGLRSYIDEQYHVFDGRVEAIENPQTFQMVAADIVKNAIWIHGFPFADDFPGFTDVIRQKAADIKALDGFQVLVNGQRMELPRANKVGIYTFQRMVYDLKESTEMEVSVFLNANMSGSSQHTTTQNDSPFLTQKDFSIDPSEANRKALSNLKPNPTALFGEDPAVEINSESNREADNALAPFAAKVVQLLEQNSKILLQYNERFENLQSQIDDLREQRPDANAEVRKEIAELREMIRNLDTRRPLNETAGSSADLPADRGLRIIFEKNAYELTLAQKAKLNTVEIALRKHPNYAALITGFADKTGDPDYNAWISKERAKSVKEYLISRGVASDRLIVNFLGDSQSTAPNPEDRKVTITYLAY